MIDIGKKYFSYSSRKTDFRTELIAGVTTFLTMAYIMILNPVILSDGGFSFGGVFMATAITSAVACIAMGLFARTWAVGLAPGMGINAFVAYGVCGGMGFSPEEALGAVIISGVVFLLVSMTPVRKWLINSIPKSLKLGIGAGIGLFLAIIGVSLMGISAEHPGTLVTLGDVKAPMLLLGAAAFVTMVVLERRNVKGGIIISIIFWSAVAWVFGLAKFNGIVSAPPPMDLAFKFTLGSALSASMVTIIFVLFFIDLFDSAGTLTSIANVTGKINSKGEVEDIDKALVVDSAASVVGGALGTTTCTTYVESAAGVKAGGRTGMTSIVIGILFLLTIFFAPLATSLPKEIDAAALIYVAVLFVRNITDISWNQIEEAAPAVLAMIAMPLTYSISHGIAIAFVAYAAIKICSGDAGKVNPAIWVISILSLISFWVA